VNKKKALVITDETEIMKSAAQAISNALAAFDVKTCTAETFAGTDLLPAAVFFIGCETPNPASFSYLEKLLSHINLASRKCGIFSTNEDALKYLAGAAKDSEAYLREPLLITNGKIDEAAIESWIKSILN
jgi:hypothetical protein